MADYHTELIVEQAADIIEREANGSIEKRAPSAVTPAPYSVWMSHTHDAMHPHRSK